MDDCYICIGSITVVSRECALAVGYLRCGLIEEVSYIYIRIQRVFAWVFHSPGTESNGNLLD